MTHVGCVRAVNEDAIYHDADGICWAVADGMGGHGHGDMAAGMAVAALSEMTSFDAPAVALRHAVATANDRIFAHAQRERLGPIGTTLVAAVVRAGMAHVVWVGDSRAYRWRHGHLEALTRDHSVVQDLIDRGHIVEAEAEAHPQRHVVTRAVGVRPMVQADYVASAVVPGDRLLLCSDGLTACVDETDIETLLGADAPAETICSDLVETALSKGAPDNVSVAIVTVEAV